MFDRLFRETADPDLARLREMLDHFVGARAATSPELRRAVVMRAAALGGAGEAAAPDGVPDDVRAYVDKVALAAYEVRDRDVEDLKGAGYGEDEIYEITLAASLGVSLARLEKGFTLLEASER